jgi:hypothetical protein
MEKQKLPKLTKQDLIFVDKVVETGKLTKSAQEAYKLDNPRYATQKAQRLIAKDSIIEAINVKRQTLKEALIEEGINEKYLAQKVNVLLKAVDKEGNTDYTAVDKGLKHATNIYGIEDINDRPKDNVYNFFFEPTFQQNIRNYDENFKNQFLNNNVEEDKTV